MKLFLDDIREPVDCVTYMHTRIGKRNTTYLENDWIVVRNYGEFVTHITQHGLPQVISFDHDLAREHYSDPTEYESMEDYYNSIGKEKTGYDCAKWLKEYCITKTYLSLRYLFTV